MEKQIEGEFLLEKSLKDKNDDLHQRVKDGVLLLEKMLWNFLPRFPDFTDHSILHSLDVLYYCNALIGIDQIQKLTPEECYVLIMSCYLHDIGMGVNEQDYKNFSEKIDFGDYFLTRDKQDEAAIVRDFHNEYSGLFIRKYAQLFDVPSEDLVFAIVQVSRGHRKTDLYSETEYPDIMTPNGIIRTAYLAAVIRLADEIDVGSDRNPEILFDTSQLTRKRDIEAFGTHESICKVEVQKEQIVLYIKPKSPEYIALIDDLAGKIQKTLDYCRDVVSKRSDLRISQTRVVTETYYEEKEE